jgi:hypothetical protein
MNKTTLKLSIRKITTWIVYIFAVYFLFQILKLLYILIFDRGVNPL